MKPTAFWLFFFGILFLSAEVLAGASGPAISSAEARKRWSGVVVTRLNRAVENNKTPLSVRELAAKLNVSTTSVRHYLTGQIDLNLERSWTAAALLKVDWEWLAAADEIRKLAAGGFTARDLDGCHDGFCETFIFVIHERLPGNLDRVREMYTKSRSQFLKDVKRANDDWGYAVAERVMELTRPQRGRPDWPTLNAIAEAIDVVPKKLSDIRYGRTTLPLESGEALAKLFDVSLEWLLALETLQDDDLPDPELIPDTYRDFRDALTLAKRMTKKPPKKCARKLSKE